MSKEEFDPRSFYVGKFTGSASAWCEAARSEAKDMSLSSPFPPEDYVLLLPHIERAAEENEVKFYLEKTLMTTDLFADIDMTGRWVFIIYKKDHILEDYIALKTEKESLEKSRKYYGQSRKDIAVRMGRLLGYSEEYIAKRMKKVVKSTV